MGKRIVELKITKKKAVKQYGTTVYKHSGIKLKPKWQSIIDRKNTDEIFEEFKF